MDFSTIHSSRIWRLRGIVTYIAPTGWRISSSRFLFSIGLRSVIAVRGGEPLWAQTELALNCSLGPNFGAIAGCN